MSALAYRDRVTITRQPDPADRTRTATGGWAAGSPVAVYTGACDFQEGATRFRNADGAVVDGGDGRLYLPEGAAWNALRVADAVAITYREGDTGTFRIAEVDRLDGSAVVQRDQPDSPAA